MTWEFEVVKNFTNEKNVYQKGNGIGKVGKIIQAREEDDGGKGTAASVLFVYSLISGLIGIPIGAVLSAVMQGILKNSSIPVMYGFFLGPVFIAMMVGFFVIKKEIEQNDHMKCGECKERMDPMTEMDLLFKIPAKEEQKYDDALGYLAGNMERIGKIRDLEKFQRGCYVCVYQCRHCSKRLVRVKDFLPLRGTCLDRGTYYFDYGEFIKVRGREDLTD